MKETISKIKKLLVEATIFLENKDKKDLEIKKSSKKWSKKEILGHLIDSGINNLQRFTEIQYESQPYLLRKYKQNESVIANKYNEAPASETLSFWHNINQSIIRVIEELDEDSLALQVDLGEGKIVNLQFIINDYVDHMEHHLKQIMS